MSIAPFDTAFAHSVVDGKYMRPHGETHWNQTADRATHFPMEALAQRTGKNYDWATEEIQSLIRARYFMPGGRYLYASGNAFHQVQNCLLLSCEDSREGWADLGWKAEMALLTGAGIGVYWGDVRANGSPVGRTGGVASGPIPKAVATNEQGRAAIQGGSRRAAIWGGLLWSHGDIFDWITAKDWPPYLKQAKLADPSTPAPLDMTNISVCLDDEFFQAFENPEFKSFWMPDSAPDGGAWHNWAQRVYWTTVDHMTQTGEPGFSVDLGDQRDEKLRNACVPGDTRILTDKGYVEIQDVVGNSVNVWNGSAWSPVVPKETGRDRELVTVLLSDGSELTCTTNHAWVLADGSRPMASELEVDDALIRAEYPVVDYGKLPEVDAYTQGFYEGDGVKNRHLIYVYKPKEAVLDRLDLANVASEWSYGRKRARPSKVLPKGFVPFHWSLAGRLEWLAGFLDADGCAVQRGGIQIGNISPELLRDVKLLLTTLGAASKVRFAQGDRTTLMPDGNGGLAPFECSAIERLLIPASSVKRLVDAGMRCSRLDLSGATGDIRINSKFVRVVDVIPAGIAERVYCFTEPEENMGVFEGTLTGQCCEIVTADDSDICNLGGLVLPRFNTPGEFEKAVRLGVLYLTAGTVYSDVPYARVAEIREKNRRLGLDLLGIHEFCLMNGVEYGSDQSFEVLEPYMKVYDRAMEFAHDWQDSAGLSRSVAVTSGAPTGTRAIAAETTTGWEPVTAVAYKRTVIASQALRADERVEHYVVDPTVARLVAQGHIKAGDPVEDSYSLAENYERRFQMQKYAQSHIDQAVSMTINLPHVMTSAAERRQFGETLYHYLPSLRGITVYPNGAIAGQPITPVPLEEALSAQNIILEESEDKCASGVCGI